MAITRQGWDDWTAQHRAGRDDYPELFWRLWINDRGWRDDLDGLAYALSNVWVMPDHPTLGALTAQNWRTLFGAVGYLVDDRRAEHERPNEPLTLYRGAHPKFRRGMSWTDSLERAQWYTDYRSPGGSQVYRATVPPSALLARMDSRNEDEYVVDMRGIRTHVAS